MNFITTFLFLLLTLYISESKERWINFNNTNSPLPIIQCNDILLDNNFDVWICTTKGIAKKSGDSWILYDSVIMGIDDNHFSCITKDKIGNYWFGTKSGFVCRFDNSQWLFWKFDGEIKDIKNENSNIWISGINFIAKFENNEWIVVDFTSIWPLIQGYSDIEIDSNGVVWILTINHGIIRYNGEFDLIYDESMHFLTDLTVDSENNIYLSSIENIYIKKQDEDAFVTLVDIPDTCGTLRAIEIDKNNVIWMGIFPYGSMMFGKYESKQFTYFYNDSIDNFAINKICIDQYNNKWLSTYNRGILVFNENGIILNKYDTDNFWNMNILPNPFSEKTKISFNLEFPSITKITIYNAIGYVIDVLADGYLCEGTHEFTFDGSDLASGTYYYVFQAGGKVETGKLVLIK